MKLKFNSVLKNFKNIFNKNKVKKITEKDFLKNKNKILIIFSAISAMLIAAIVFLGLQAPPVDFGEKTIIYVPTKKKLSNSKLFEIKDTASNILETKCSIQQTENEKELNIIDEKQQIKINLEKLYIKNISHIKKRFEDLKNSLNKNYPELINIKNTNEILVENYTSNKYSDYFKNLLFIVLTILSIVFLYFLIAYRKINGFFAFSSFLVSLILNILAIVAMLMAIVVGFSLEINSSVMLEFTTILTIVFLNLFLNFSTIFNCLKQNLKEQNNLSLALNSAINNCKKVIFNNFLIFNAISSICFLAFNLLNSQFNFEMLPQFLAVAATILFAGIYCHLITIYFTPNIFMQLKKIRFKKPKKEQIKKEQPKKVKV